MKQRQSFAFSLFSLAIASAFLMNCKPNARESQVKEIIGADNRADIKDDRILSRLGLLNVGDHKCNAVLVAPDTIATVVHCLDSKNLGTIVGLTFTTAEGKSALVKQLLTIDKKKDLALYRLDKSGFNFFAPKLESKIAESIVVAGFDTTKNRWLHASCEIKEKSSEFASFTYDCDTAPGMSGSAVISNDRVIGLHVAYDKQLNQNLALDFSTVSNPSAEIAKRPRINLEWPPCICCHGCDVPKLELPSWEGFQGGMLDQLKNVAAPAVGEKAMDNGWSYPECLTSGLGVVTAVCTPAYTMICTATGLATAGTGVPPCLAWIGGTSGIVVGVACKQSCVDGRIKAGCPSI